MHFNFSISSRFCRHCTAHRSNGSVPGDYAISGEERPNYVYGVALTPPGGSTPAEWVNPAAFSIPASRTFGNLGRNAFRARSISDVDLALAKDASLAERTTVRFRADVFNVLNRAQYGAPNAGFSQNNVGVITTTISSYADGVVAHRESFSLRPRSRFSAPDSSSCQLLGAISGALWREKGEKPVEFRLWIEEGTTRPLPLRIEYQPKPYLRLTFEAFV